MLASSLTAIPPPHMINTVSDAATEPERIYARFCRALNARDWDALRDCVAEDYEAYDHRPLGYGQVRGRDEVMSYWRSWDETVTYGQWRFEWLSGDDEHAVLRFGGYGTAVDELGGGALEIVLVSVVTVRAGRVSRAEHFDL